MGVGGRTALEIQPQGSLVGGKGLPLSHRHDLWGSQLAVHDGVTHP